jgi:superfamily II DNA/RNA helicase
MKISTLMAHLENSKMERIVVFTASKRTADRLFRIILKKNWGVVSVDETINKETYNERFKKFTDNEMKILVVGSLSATDIDLDKVTQVINYDVPSEVDEYRYRAELVGSGKAGQMVSLVSKMDRDDIDKITKEVGYAPEEIKLPEEVKKKKKGNNSSNKNKKKGNDPRNKTRRGSSSSNRSKKKKEEPKEGYGLPRPNYDGLSGGREGERSGGVFGWVKKLFN